MMSSIINNITAAVRKTCVKRNISTPQSISDAITCHGINKRFAVKKFWQIVSGLDIQLEQS